MPYFLEENFTNVIIFTEWFDLLDTNHDNSIDKYELFQHFKGLQHNSENSELDDTAIFADLTYDTGEDSDYEDREHRRRSL